MSNEQLLREVLRALLAAIQAPIPTDEVEVEQQNDRIKRAVLVAETALAQPAEGGEVAGWCNAGQLYELQQGRAPYAYVYAEKQVGASTPIYITPPASQEQAQQTADHKKPMQNEPGCEHENCTEEHLGHDEWEWTCIDCGKKGCFSRDDPE